MVTRRKAGITTDVCADSSTPWRLTLYIRVSSKTPAAETKPQITEILATGENLISLNNSIASIEERRPACLQLHSVEDQPITPVMH